MSKSIIKYVILGITILFSIMYINLTLIGTKITVDVENIEALAVKEVDIFELCKKSGGHCMVSTNQDVYGISIED